MKLHTAFATKASILVTLATLPAIAQAPGAPQPPPPVEMSDVPPETGFLLQARMQTQQGLLSIAGTAPGFLLGYQYHGAAIGVGLGYSRLGLSMGNDVGSASATLFEVTPTLIVDVWRSHDQRTRANLVGSVGYGKASVTVTVTNQNCTFDALGNSICTSTTSDTTSKATLIPVQIGFGGDHYLSRHFAIGAEAGVQLLFLSGLESGGQSVNASASTQALYGLLRLSLLLGE